jgi:hypothetical protein
MENLKEKGDPRPVTLPKIIAQQSTSSTDRINGMDADVHADGGFVSRILRWAIDGALKWRDLGSP